MRRCGEHDADGTGGEGPDVILIEDSPRFGTDAPIRVEKCEGALIITTRTEQAAAELLRTVAVDVVCNFRGQHTHGETESFRSLVSARYPGIRVIDLWTPVNG